MTSYNNIKRELPLFAIIESMNNLIKSKLELSADESGLLHSQRQERNHHLCGEGQESSQSGAVLFQRSHDTKTEALVSEIVDFEFIVTESNIEALLS